MTMKTEIALYDAFTELPFGGSQAAVIADASAIPADLRAQIARELGMPATAFVDAIDGERITVQFHSTVMELPMCGHGTICLMTHLAETGLVELGRGDKRSLSLHLPQGSAQVELERRSDSRIEVMLDVAPPRFEPAPADIEAAARTLGLSTADFAATAPVEVARGDFVHLVLPLAGLTAMRAIQPDFGAIVDYCHRHRLETFAAYCLETENPDCNLHVRDFCPAVGVSESAAAGTTNAALSSFLLRHGMVEPDSNGCAEIRAEQGIELGRPSSVRSQIQTDADGIQRLRVGGVATRVLRGEVYLP